MAFINDDNDIWGDASSKTSEGKFNSSGVGYGRHGSTRDTYGRHASSSRGQGNDLLADAQDFLLDEDLPRGGGRRSNAMEECGGESANEPASEPPNDLAVRA